MHLSGFRFIFILNHIFQTPLMTLPGHKEAISGVIWTENNEVISSSWDHTIKGIKYH